MRWPYSRAVLLGGVMLSLASGCAESYFPVVNCEAPPAPERTAVARSENGVLASEARVPDLLWLEIERPNQAGTVGGYYAAGDEPRGGLILLLTGASTLHVGRRPEAAMSLYNDYGFRFQRESFGVWVLALSEDTPYGAKELDELIDVIDWLDAEGRAFLGVERVYVLGYSPGATTANLVNLERDVTAVVSLGGLAQGEQLQTMARLYRQITALFPCNTGMHQLWQTVDTYSRLSEDPLDVVSRVTEIRNPTLFVHALDDIIYYPASTQSLERAYREQLAGGNTALPPLEFRYYPTGGHFVYVLDPDLFPPVLEYLNKYEPD